MGTMHGQSHKTLKHFRERPAALAVYWIYVSRANHEGVAWPSLRGLGHDTNWSYNACREAREWLVEHNALERVEQGYVRPKWRTLDSKEKARLLNLDHAEYYRITGTIEINGKICPLLYFGGFEPSDIEEDEVSDESRGASSVPPIIGAVHQARGESELDSIMEGDSKNTEDNPNSNTISFSDEKEDSLHPPLSPSSQPVTGNADTSFPQTVVEGETTPPNAVNPPTMYDAIVKVWKYTTGLNGLMAKMLAGTADKKGWAEYNLETPITAQELLDWAEWYRETELHGDDDLNMVAERIKVQSSITYWQSIGKPRVGEVTEDPTIVDYDYDHYPYGEEDIAPPDSTAPRATPEQVETYWTAFNKLIAEKTEEANQ